MLLWFLERSMFECFMWNMNSGNIKVWKLSAFFGCVFSNGPVVFSKFFPQLWGVRVVHCRVLYTGLYGNCKNEKSSLIGFLAHLSQRLKWAFLIKICPYSVVVVVVVYVAINLLFHLLLQNHWAIFNQTCHKAPFVEGYLSLFK